MITLVFTYYVVAYLLIPAGLFRFTASLFLKLKQFQRTKTQEFVFAVGAAILPFSVAWIFVLADFWPWPLPVGGSLPERWADYTRVYEGIVSDKIFSSAASTALFWSAVERVWHRQVNFLSCYWAIIILEALLFAFLIKKYPAWRNNSAYSYVADKALLPHLSEWTLLFSPSLSLGSEPPREVWLDVVTADGTLYRGLLADFFLDQNGNLTGFLLASRQTDPGPAETTTRVPTFRSPLRFDRERYLQCRESRPYTCSPAAFWRHIPSGAFYIPHDKVVNLNVTYVETHPEATLNQATRELIEQGFEFELRPFEDPRASIE
jgi:hypothetical protein